MQAIQDIFGIWPSTAALAADISAKPDTVRKWKKFRRIPQDSWQGLILAAARRGHFLTVDLILSANAPMKPRGRPAHKPRPAKRKRSEARAS